MQQTIPVNDAYIASHVGTTPSTGPFAVDFPFFSLNDVTVARQADGTFVQELLIRGADYDLVGVATEDGSFSSGSVTLYLPIANSTLIRFRTTPVERLSNFPLQGFFSRLALNAELNRITVWMQELHGMLGTTSEASQAHAPIASPLFTGDPRAPTPPLADNDSSIATTAFVNQALVGVGAAVPSGVITDYGGVAAPPGWLMCQGQAVNRVAYAGLFAAIGTLYNVGGEAGTDFRLPDLRGRVTASLDSGGSNRLNVAIPTSTALGAAGGSQTVTLSTSEMPAHSHTVNDAGHGHTLSMGNATVVATNRAGFGDGNNAGPNGSIVVNSLTGVWLSNTGGGLPHLNTQPTFMLNKIIKT